MDAIIRNLFRLTPPPAYAPECKIKKSDSPSLFAHLLFGWVLDVFRGVLPVQTHPNELLTVKKSKTLVKCDQSQCNTLKFQTPQNIFLPMYLGWAQGHQQNIQNKKAIEVLNNKAFRNA